MHFEQSNLCSYDCLTESSLLPITLSPNCLNKEIIFFQKIGAGIRAKTIKYVKISFSQKMYKIWIWNNQWLNIPVNFCWSVEENRLVWSNYVRVSTGYSDIAVRTWDKKNEDKFNLSKSKTLCTWKDILSFRTLKLFGVLDNTVVW